MGKLLAIGLWACIVTLGAVYGAIHFATAPAEPSGEPEKVLELVSGESITVPVIQQGGVTGYFITRISFMVDKEKAKAEELPLTQYMTDQLFTMLTGDKMIDLGNVKAFDVNLFRDKIKTYMNERLGGEIIQQVLVEQIDYVSQEAARRAAGGQSLERTQIVEEAAPPVEKPASGH